MCNIPIYFCNIDIKQLQHNYETFETVDADACNMRFQHIISLVLGRIEARRRVEFTDIELVGGAEIRRSGGEGRDRSGGESRGGSPHCAGGARGMHGVSSAASYAWASSIPTVASYAQARSTPATTNWAGGARDVRVRASLELL